MDETGRMGPNGEGQMWKRRDEGPGERDQVWKSSKACADAEVVDGREKGRAYTQTPRSITPPPPEASSFQWRMPIVFSPLPVITALAVFITRVVFVMPPRPLPAGHTHLPRDFSPDLSLSLFSPRHLTPPSI